MTLPTVDQLARIIDALAFEAPPGATTAGEKKLRHRRARAVEKATTIRETLVTMRGPLADKIEALISMQQRLNESVAELFPPGSPIKWRTPNSFDQTGVVNHVLLTDGQLRIRVVDDIGHFSCNLSLADVLRAAS
jgi:hypothetical protein